VDKLGVTRSADAFRKLVVEQSEVFLERGRCQLLPGMPLDCLLHAAQLGQTGLEVRDAGFHLRPRVVLQSVEIHLTASRESCPNVDQLVGENGRFRKGNPPQRVEQKHAVWVEKDQPLPIRLLLFLDPTGGAQGFEHRSGTLSVGRRRADQIVVSANQVSVLLDDLLHQGKRLRTVKPLSPLARLTFQGVQ
jgi:hypothetical protein